MATRDNLLIANIHGAAMKSAADHRDIDEAIAELREIAGGRDDLLAQAAGVSAGAWTAGPSTRNPYELIGCGLIASAASPLDFHLLERWVTTGYNRGLMNRRPIHG